MGTLRTVFAIAVVLSHVWPGGPVFVGGQNAVQLFYIISGFLISFVLVERKSYPSATSFYVNRYLRLYPIYLVVAAISLCTRGSDFFEIYKHSASADALLIFSNAFLVGQDWIMFGAVKGHYLQFTTNFWNSDFPLFHGLLVKPAWTLGVELSFYAIAPFILPRRRAIYVLLTASVLLRGYLVLIGIGGNDPWTYRFFPTELALFLLGVLVHQILLPVYVKHMGKAERWLPEVATAVMVVMSVEYFEIPGPEPTKRIFLFTGFIALLPFAFIFSQRNRTDRWIGDLSYPIYIVHMLAIELVRYLTIGIDLLDFHYMISLNSVITSILFAILLNKLIGRPVEKLRERFRSDHRVRYESHSIPYRGSPETPPFNRACLRPRLVVAASRADQRGDR
jgi:peptidoglycan/LPS O-acetylase OafA/YrhL